MGLSLWSRFELFSILFDQLIKCDAVLNQQSVQAVEANIRGFSVQPYHSVNILLLSFAKVKKNFVA